MVAPPFELQSPASFGEVTTRPYSPDGGFHAEGLALTAAVGIGSGVVAGLVFGLVGQWFYLIILFPILIGLLIGSAQKFVIHRAKIRNTLACGAVGLLAGLVAVVTIHYVDYEAFKYFRAEAAAEIDEFRQLVRKGVYTQAEFDDALREYNNDPEVQAMKSVDSFPAYVDWAARQGIEVSGSRPSSAKGINLGYVGTYLYWSVDAIIIAAVVMFLTRTQAAEPYCTECDSWKEPVELGRLSVKANQVAGILESGRLSELAKLTQNLACSTAISAYICDKCHNAEDIVLQASEITVKDGKEVLTSKGRFHCDSTAVEELDRFFDSCQTVQPADEETQQLVEAANSVYAQS